MKVQPQWVVESSSRDTVAQIENGPQGLEARHSTHKTGLVIALI